MRRTVAGRVSAGSLALLGLAGPLLAERPPDFFGPLRGPTFVESDETYVVKGRGAPASEPGLARLRVVVLRLRAYGAWSDELKFGWPERKLLLVTTPDGKRVVAESLRMALTGTGEPEPWHRVATKDSSVEVFSLEDADVSREFLRAAEAGGNASLENFRDEEARQKADACRGHRGLLVAGDARVSYFIADRARRTVAAEADAALSATFSLDDLSRLRELRDLLLKVESAPEAFTRTRSALGVILGWNPLVGKRPAGDLVLVPETPDPGDLAALRALTHLPANLPRFVPPPETSE